MSDLNGRVNKRNGNICKNTQGSRNAAWSLSGTQNPLQRFLFIMLNLQLTNSASKM
jgi:hypothetical protein